MGDQADDRSPSRSKHCRRQGRREIETDQAVGYCSPPREYQWPAGHCPNPNGRPKKRECTVKKSSMPNEFEQRLLEEARNVIGEVNGVPIDNIGRTWLRLKSNMERPEVAKFVLQQYASALEKDRAWREVAVADLLAYKAHWEPIFETRRMTKRPLPSQYPHPEDILITSATSFTFLGPVTEQEARDWKFFRESREVFFMIAQEIIDWSGDVVSVEEGYQQWAKLRRKYYRVNRHLPVLFKKKYPATFPPFKPRTV